MKDLEKVSLLKEASPISREDSHSHDYHSVANGPTDEITPLQSNGIAKPTMNRQKSLVLKEGMTLSWENINVQTPPQKQGGCLPCGKKKEPLPPKRILKDVSGAVQPGTLMVTMGASGSGKTTLINCLTKRNLGALTVSGEIRVNGQIIDEDINSISGYVQQEDLFVGTMTVSEHLWFQARLRMDSDISIDEKKQRIQDVMVEMGLLKCKDVFIGVPGMLKGLSGGEKKRLSFATELLRNPPILFCDEPTSGLDSFMAQSVMEILLNLANNGRTLLCTVHQPSSNVFQMFDKLLLMAEGRVAYMGETSYLNEFFRGYDMECPPNFNPADFYIQSLAIVPGNEIECRAKVNAICDGFKETSQARGINWEIEQNSGQHDDERMDKFVMEMEKVEKNFNGAGQSHTPMKKEERKASNGNKYLASWWTQFALLYWRCWIDVKRNRRVLPARVGQITTAGLLLGLVYYQQTYNQTGVANINSALFMLMIQVSFNTAFTIATSFAREFPVFIKEHKDRAYKVSAYYIAKVMTDLPVFLLAATIYTATSYWMIGLNPNFENFLICWAGLLLLSYNAIAFGHMASAIFPNPQLALTLLPFILGLSLIFSGFLVKEDSILPIFIPFQALSVYRYGYKLLLLNQWDNIQTLGCETAELADSLRSRWNITLPTNSSALPLSSPESSNWCFPNGDAVVYSYGYDPNDGVWDLFLINISIFLAAEFLGFICLYAKAKKAR